MYIACQKGLTNIVAILLRNGADTDISGLKVCNITSAITCYHLLFQGYEPIVAARRNKHTDIVNLLLKQK